jgi:3-oxoacyl-(acyl-carrier-protein) synthase
MDEAEAEVMETVFRDGSPRAISVKDAVGEMAASGAGQVVAACRALADRDGPFPANAAPRRALVNSFGAGGNFLAAVFESA